MTPAGIEPATFRFVAQHLNHCATAVSRMVLVHCAYSVDAVKLLFCIVIQQTRIVDRAQDAVVGANT